MKISSAPSGLLVRCCKFAAESTRNDMKTNERAENQNMKNPREFRGFSFPFASFREAPKWPEPGYDYLRNNR